MDNIDVMTGTGGSLLIPVPDGSHFGLIAGATPLMHCVRAMTAGFDTVVVAVAVTHAADARAVAPAGAVVVEVGGRATRGDCLRAGLAALPSPEYVVVHDISRPLTPTAVADRVRAALVEGIRIVVPTLVVVDSVKSVDERGTVLSTVDRSTLRSTQFPRGMTSSLLLEALDADTDELDYALRSGIRVTMVDGDPHGLEIAAPRDTALAEAIIANA